jgi:hypothetical protein
MSISRPTAQSRRGAPLRRVRGSHLIFPRIRRGGEAIAYFDEQGRIVFLIPWGENGDLTLVGTTDVDHTGGPDDVCISAGEAEYLKSIVHRLFPGVRTGAGGKLQFAAAIDPSERPIRHIDQPRAQHPADCGRSAAHQWREVHHLPSDERGTGRHTARRDEAGTRFPLKNRRDSARYSDAAQRADSARALGSGA